MSWGTFPNLFGTSDSDQSGRKQSPNLQTVKKKWSVVFYLYMGVVEVEQNGVSDNLDTFQLRPEDWFTICMKLVPLSREWRQLRPQPSGLFTA